MYRTSWSRKGKKPRRRSWEWHLFAFVVFRHEKWYSRNRSIGFRGCTSVAEKPATARRTILDDVIFGCNSHTQKSENSLVWMILLGRIRFCALILDLEKIDFLILKFIENTVLLTKIEKYDLSLEGISGFCNANSCSIWFHHWCGWGNYV